MGYIVFQVFNQLGITGWILDKSGDVSVADCLFDLFSYVSTRYKYTNRFGMLLTHL